ncbi:dihydrofolate reductase [Kribbella pratensis]|jgi:dihydrofolate reductase|uniref:Dihydrofolate reductase n=1 Tax=Kribbella pratensis TaxID=2512112 RepID=A0ABY2F8M5_9ACTN|nr:dihydrofolate reductase family protein [Kribbella pratensis]TDW84503.1 dihydrofolate reductase [Kribbella pratensis]
MRKLIESTFVTLNGVIDEPQNWSPPYWDEEHMAYNQSLMEGVEGQVLGRVTYEGFADAWLSRAGDPLADSFNAMPKWVASRTVTEWKWNAQPLEGDAAEAVRKLKESEGGDLIKYGTGSFSKTLLENKLVDEYHFWIFPVVAEGATMFQGTGIDITHLDLLGTTTFKSGIVVHKLAPKA